ncbi:uncharacterized protein LOC131256776 isoform X2 [Magnolia sinica]|uniref:uncharacterized protein LOC131256776 isoform X2 n=1 Tax=Magnolia sinica TaxID=86752 RepID=UPI0026580933|nr:uncharacterized protein LOC131256776 isoform X2 [Magnolia sinica]
MPLEFPSSLIHQIQIRLRSEAGIPSYDPDRPSLNLPSLDEAIAEFDPSPPYLRCSQCRGRLLRGIQSMICVYCGSEQRRDGPLPSVSFNSTFGFRKLLESLEVDGSEPVVLGAATSESSGGRNASKDKLVLSDLLDVEIRWPEASGEIQNSIMNVATGAAEEYLIRTEQIKSTEIHTSSYQESVSMFPNFQSSDMAVNSAETSGGKMGDSFSVWEAEFQSASSGTLPVDLKSAEPFVGSSPIDLTRSVEAVAAASDSGIDMTFQISNQSNDGEFKNNPDQLSSMNDDDWDQDDIWHTGDAKVSSKTGQAEFQSASSGTPVDLKSDEPVVGSSPIDLTRSVEAVAAASDSGIDMKFQISNQSNNGEFKNNPDQLSSMNDDDWGQDDIWHTGDEKVSSKTGQAEFQSASSGTPPVDLKSADPFVGSSPIDLTRSVEAVAATSDLGIDMKFQTSNQSNDGEFKNNPDQPSSMNDDDWGQDDIWHTGDAKVSSKTGQFEINSRASDGELKNESINTSVSDDWIQDDLWKSGSTSVTTNAEKTKENRDSFDIWQDFASSGNAPDPFANSWPQTGASNIVTNGNALEKDFMSVHDDLEEMDFGGFVQSDTIAGTSSIQKGSTDANTMQSENSPLDRMEGKDGITGLDTESQVVVVNGKNLTASRSAPSTDANVEMLISQMPDLSYMLESNLSIPPKAKGTDLIL